MTFIDFVVRNPVKTAVGVLLLALFGAIALGAMPMQLTPEVVIPTITIDTPWPGASPQEVEREIVLEQEEQLKGVEGVTKMTSECMDSLGRITLEFPVGADMQEVLLKVNSRLQQVPEYPEDADEPVISTTNSSDRAIAWFILSALPPTDAQYDAFLQRRPDLADEIAPIRDAHNPGLALMRLRRLVQQHPEAAELSPTGVDVTELRRYSENIIEARFERVPGVANSNVVGGLEDEIQVIVDPQKLASRRLTIADVRNTLREQNEDTSGGNYWEGKRRYTVRTLGQFRSMEQVEKQVLAVRDGTPVYIRDVADVRHGFKKPDGLVRRYGTSCIAVNVLRDSGANVLRVMDGLREANRELNDTVLKRDRLQLSQVYDETEYIYSSVGLVRQNIFIGGALTMIVLMLFLHRGVKTVLFAAPVALTAVAAAYLSPWFFAISLALILLSGFWFARGALVVGLAIPISIVGTFLVLHLLGRSLNVISLAGLAFAVGMLVDNAVVVLENIYRRYQEGEPRFVAAVRGAGEVWGAVAASTLTTLAVFLPVVFVEEEAGQLFRDIALAISSAVGLSLIISITLIPTAAARLLKGSGKDDTDRDDRAASSDPKVWAVDERNGDEPRPDSGDGQSRSRLAGVFSKTAGVGRAALRPLESMGGAFTRWIVNTNSWFLGGVVRRIALVVGLLGASAVALWVFWPKVEYLPNGNRNLVFGILLPPPGYNIDQLMDLGEQIEDGLRPYFDVDPGSPEAQRLDGPMVGDFFFVVREGRVFLGVRSWDPLRADELVGVVQRVTGGLPGTFAVVSQSSLFERGLTAGRTIDIEITGPELEELVGIGGRILGKSQEVVPNAQVRPVPSLDLSTPELHFHPRLEEAADLGVGSTDLGYTVNALIDGAYATDYYLGGDKIDLTILGKPTDERTEYSHDQTLRGLPVATPVGKLVRLDTLADIELASGPEQINRRERQRAITIQVTPPTETPLEEAMDNIRAEIVEPMLAGQLSEDYMIRLSGTADKLASAWDALYFNLLFAAVITYLLMAALFESWLYPLVIISSVLLGMIGGVLGLNLLNVYLALGGVAPQTLDVLTMLGFVILIGTVVNNPILIVHQSLNHIRDEDMSPDRAILESVRTRIRPIFMTTTTTVLGLAPLVLFPGAGSELYRGLGSVVLGGLVVSTFFTLFLVPTLFSLTMQAKGALVRLLWPEGEIEESPVRRPMPQPVAPR